MVLKGKVAIVTGAGGGVGREISKRLVSEGCKVVLVGRNRDRLAKAASEAGDRKNTLTFVADITKEAEVLSAMEQALSSFDRIDILVNNAGSINDPACFHETGEDQWSELVDTNLIGTFQVTKAALPIMMKNKGGSIVNISSVLGIRSIPKVPFAVYGATKAGIIMFTKSIAVEYGQYRHTVQLHSAFYHPKLDDRAVPAGRKRQEGAGIDVPVAQDRRAGGRRRRGRLPELGRRQVGHGHGAGGGRRGHGKAIVHHKINFLCYLHNSVT